MSSKILCYTSTMGRDKLRRNLQFKPRYKLFGAVGHQNSDEIHLLHEEMEALYLMDAKTLYQAEAAEVMGVSRPTFARILKSARQKVTMMLISGANLKIDDEKKECLVMIPSVSDEYISKSMPTADYLHLYEVEEHQVRHVGVIPNPVATRNLRPGQIIPKLCVKYSVNFFVANSIGIGLKNTLLSKGVYSYKMDEDINVENLYTLLAI